MQRFALPLLFLVGCAIAAPGTEKRIVGGGHAKHNAHPYIASIRHKLLEWGHNCGGVIISKTWILTAAHCVYNRNQSTSFPPTDLSVDVGSNHRNMYDQRIGVSKIIYHKDFQYASTCINHPAMGALCNDIAVLKLERPIELNENVAIAKMAPEGSSFVNTTCFMSGWGKTLSKISPLNLQDVKIMVIPNTECDIPIREYLNSVIDEYYDDDDDEYYLKYGVGPGHICTFDKNNLTNTCGGDSGGPMMCGENHKLLAGLTSFGDANCTGNVPGVFTRVTYYLDWIKQITGVEP